MSRIRPADLLLPALFAAIGAAEMVVQGFGPLWVSIGTYWLAALALCARRAFPLTVPLVVAGIHALTPLLGFDVSLPASWLLPLPLACLAAGLYTPRSHAVAGVASVTGSLVLVFGGLDILTDFNPDILFALVWTIGPWALGTWLRQAFERSRQLAAEAERARIEAELAVTSAAEAERARIARELHDVLAHSLSVMVVQASLAEDLVARDPPAAVRALREVQQSGRDALGETGRLLRLIRDDQDELGLQAQHAIADLPALVDEYARAGLDVSLVIDPAARALPLGVGLSAYRIVREALTNALKHAPGSSVSVRLDRRGDDLCIHVRNSSGTGDPSLGVPSGQGLVGLRERVSLFGGTLHAAPTGDGGFLLAATLPAPREAG